MVKELFWGGVALMLSALFAPVVAPAISDHFDGSVYFNPEPGHSFTDMVRWLWEMERVDWPDWIEDAPQPPPPERVHGRGLRVTYINHATLLIQTEGVNILTDPIWSTRAGPASFAGTGRVRAAGVDFDDLPPIDYVLISHDHYDHMDCPTLERLHAKHDPTFVTGLGVGRLLSARGIDSVVELDWWQAYAPGEGGLAVTFVPARHGSGRAPFRENRTLWGGFVIDSPGGQVYFAGDTGYGAFVDAIAARFGRIRLAILPIGNYEKRWFMQSQHMNPEDAVRAHRALGAPLSIGMHFSTFAEHPEQAIDAHERDLADALERHGVPGCEFVVPRFGEGRDVAPLSAGRAGR